MEAHAWLTVSDGRLLRADRIVEIIDGPTVSVRFADNPATLYPIPQSVPASGRELAAVLDRAEDLARHYGKAQQVTAADAPPAHWVIVKIDVSQERLAVWPPAVGNGRDNDAPERKEWAGEVAGDGGRSLLVPGPLPSDGPLPYFALGLHEDTAQEGDQAAKSSGQS